MNWTSEQIKQLVKKYPYLKPVNVWTGEEVDDYDFTYYRGDAYELPSGWSKLFLLMIKDIDPYLKKKNLVDKFYFTQIKEKYGTMRVYTNCSTKDVCRLIDLYEHYSKYVCFMCCNPTAYETKGWVEYVCKDCALKHDPENSYKVKHKNSVTFEIYSNGASYFEQYSLRPIRTKYNKVRNMSDNEFFEYIMSDVTEKY